MSRSGGPESKKLGHIKVGGPPARGSGEALGVHAFNSAPAQWTPGGPLSAGPVAVGIGSGNRAGADPVAPPGPVAPTHPGPAPVQGGSPRRRRGAG